MLNTNNHTQILLTLVALVVLSLNALAADPGLTYPSKSELGDDKAGSLLIYNIYSSTPASPEKSDTRINITNTNPTTGVAVHLFFVDGATCSVADSFICLGRNQTASFQMRDVDPGVTGYLIAVAVDKTTGCPISFNFLIGDELVRFPTGHKASLGAVAFAALYNGVLPGCDDNSSLATIAFDGATGYNALPRVLALDNIPSRADGNDTILILNRIGGSLMTKTDAVGAIQGILYDDATIAHSFTATSDSCQLVSSLTNQFPRVAPRFEQIITAGRSGWIRLWSVSDAGLLGAMINSNANANAIDDASNGGHNLHTLTLTTKSAYVIPVFPPSC